MSNDFLSTRQLAEYLNLKDRKIYELVSRGEIPCTRVGGKWLFPRDLIDAWLYERVEGPSVGRPTAEPPPIVAGSHDPLLDWAIRASGCGLAVLYNGSLDGLERVAARKAVAGGMHVIEDAGQSYNTMTVSNRMPRDPVVLIEWAQREQGLITAAGNPLAIGSIKDLPGRRFVFRQSQAGATVLLDVLLARHGVSRDDLQDCGICARNEHEVGEAIAAGHADVGLGIASRSQRQELAFIPVARERYDLLIWRRSWFEAPIQELFRFVRRPQFVRRAAEMGGYDVSGLGRVHYNGP